MGRLERHLDSDLIAKIQNGWTPKNDRKQVKVVKKPRLADTYRAARRNARRRKPSND